MYILESGISDPALELRSGLWFHADIIQPFFQVLGPFVHCTTRLELAAVCVEGHREIHELDPAARSCIAGRYPLAGLT